MRFAGAALHPARVGQVTGGAFRMHATIAARHRRACIALPLALAVVAACSTRTALKPTARPKTSWQLITPPDAPHYHLQPDQSAQLPQPVVGHFAPPVYPAALARPGAAPVVVKAQLTFDTAGRVDGVYPLPDSYAGPGYRLFEGAVRAAVAHWRFTPLVFEQYGDPAMDAGTLRRQAKPFSLWFAFHFTMVDGKPVVETVKR